MHPNDLTLLDFKTIVSTTTSARVSIYSETYEYCYKEGIDLKTYVKCTECGIFLFLIKKGNCFKKHHS